MKGYFDTEEPEVEEPEERGHDTELTLSMGAQLGIVAARRVEHAVPMAKRHGAFPDALEHEIIQRPAARQQPSSTTARPCPTPIQIAARP